MSNSCAYNTVQIYIGIKGFTDRIDQCTNRISFINGDHFPNTFWYLPVILPLYKRD